MWVYLAVLFRALLPLERKTSTVSKGRATFVPVIRFRSDMIVNRGRERKQKGVVLAYVLSVLSLQASTEKSSETLLPERLVHTRRHFVMESMTRDKKGRGFITLSCLLLSGILSLSASEAQDCMVESVKRT